jgi:hypothetical protein
MDKLNTVYGTFNTANGTTIKNKNVSTAIKSANENSRKRRSKEPVHDPISAISGSGANLKISLGKLIPQTSFKVNLHKFLFII